MTENRKPISQRTLIILACLTLLVVGAILMVVSLDNRASAQAAQEAIQSPTPTNQQVAQVIRANLGEAQVVDRNGVVTASIHVNTDVCQAVVDDLQFHNIPSAIETSFELTILHVYTQPLGVTSLTLSAWTAKGTLVEQVSVSAATAARTDWLGDVGPKDFDTYQVNQQLSSADC